MELQQTRRQFFKKTRRGKVVQPVQEKYLHSDLECGYMCGKNVSCTNLRDMVAQAPHKQLLVIDTNIAMHQVDVLEYNCPATSLMVVLQTVLQELKHLNNSVYGRVLNLMKDSSRSFIFYPNEASTNTSVLRYEALLLQVLYFTQHCVFNALGVIPFCRAQGESVNDANDRAIVTAALYFQSLFSGSSSGSVIFITNDVANKVSATNWVAQRTPCNTNSLSSPRTQERALSKGLVSMDMRQYVSKYVTQYPELLDLVASDDSAMQVSAEGGNGAPRLLFPLHLPMHAVMEGLKARRLLKGTIRCDRDNCLDCYVVVHSADGVSRRSVKITGMSLCLWLPSLSHAALKLWWLIVMADYDDGFAGSQRVNRAIDGDVVAIELLAGAPTAAELSADARLLGHEAVGAPAAGVQEETAEPSVDELEGIPTGPAESASAAAPSATGLFGAKDSTATLYGRVVGVIRRNWRQYAGSLEFTSDASDASATGAGARDAAMDVAEDSGDASGGNAFSTTRLFVPVNRRIPRVLISTRRVEELSKSRLLVAIDHWPADSLHPQGHYVRVLGPAGSKEVETAVLLHEFDVPHEAFTPEVMACLPPAGKDLFQMLHFLVKAVFISPAVYYYPASFVFVDFILACASCVVLLIFSPDWKIAEEVVAQRTDLRHIPVVSIDPPGCKDIDDALHFVRLPNGRLEAGVHIAGMRNRTITHFAFRICAAVVVVRGAGLCKHA
jgi:exosome complex exonuclease DIS3/RRP44